MAFFMKGFTFLEVIFSLSLMRKLPDVSRAVPGQGGFGQHLFEGFHFIRQRRGIFFLISLIAVSAFLSMPYSTLMPVFAGEVLAKSAGPVVDYVCHDGPLALDCQSPEALPLGALLSTVGIGSLIGALVVASLPASAHRGRMLTIGNLAFPLLLLLFSISKSFLFSMGMLLLVGISFVWQNALANTLLQFASPDALRGRIMSVYTMVFQSSMRLGGLQAGLVADWVSAPFSVALGAVLSLGYGLYVAVRVPEVRKMV